jgi:hypothetical protein
VTVRIGFIGTGFIARTHSWFLKHTAADRAIVAVHDLDADRAQEFAGRVGAEVVDDPDQLLDRVDAVFVTTWTSEHEHLVAAAAERGVAVFCEKPLAFDASAAERMVESVEAAGVVNQVGLILRFMPQFVHAKTLLADERAGRLLAVSFRDDQFIPIQSHYGSMWRIDPERCGRGTLLEHSIHDVDIMQWLCGPVGSVSGTVREVHGHARIDDVTTARLEFDNGAVASLTSIWHDIIDRPEPAQRRDLLREPLPAPRRRGDDSAHLAVHGRAGPDARGRRPGARLHRCRTRTRTRPRTRAGRRHVQPAHAVPRCDRRRFGLAAPAARGPARAPHRRRDLRIRGRIGHAYPRLTHRLAHRAGSNVTVRTIPAAAQANMRRRIS